MGQRSSGRAMRMLGHFLVPWLLIPLVVCAAVPPDDGVIVLKEGLILRVPGRGTGRTALPRDSVARLFTTGTWKTPAVGDSVEVEVGAAGKWEQVTANPPGQVVHQALRGGYLCWTVELKDAARLILEASGHGMVYVNGELRPGDPYEHGYVRLPVSLKAGKNDLVFQGARGGRLKARLVPPSKPILLDLSDSTLPDMIRGESLKCWGALLLQNTTDQPLTGLVLRAERAGAPPIETPVPPVVRLSVRKVPFQVDGPPPQEGGTCEVVVTLLRKSGDRFEPIDSTKVGLRIRDPRDSHKRTFISSLDGSVQYYAVRPARPVQETSPEKLALFLTLHGAGVEAIGQVDAYASKSWGHLVAPTNRRPFGFDWEDWGRRDAIEVLENAQQLLRPDPQRVYLTGHSMGGHGVWHLGVTYPDRFAALGPSAGWISMWSYAGASKPDKLDPIQALVQRCASPSDTLTLARNCTQAGIYILHGDADDNVPVTQARQMVEQLGRFHRDFAVHEQKGAGHWWDASDEPGADCVDWAPMFDFFARHVRPTRESLRDIDFTTANPGVSGWCHWVGILGQTKQLLPSRVTIRHDPGVRRFAGKTENVARLALDLGDVEASKPIQVELDGQKLANIPWPAGQRRLWLAKSANVWATCSEPAAGDKGPQRHGPFKEAFANHVLLVYGTHGDETENRWALAKARYDAETLWYRGNAALDVVSDEAFLKMASDDRSVILFGNAETNAAWKLLLAESPVQVRRGQIQLGSRSMVGEDLACLLIRPRPKSRTAAVGVVGGTGVHGLRLTDRIPYAQSFTAYPDCLVLSAGTSQNVIRAAGFFGLDWSIESGEFAWETKAP